MLVVLYFSIAMIVFIAMPLSAIKNASEGTPFSKTLDAPIFIATVAIFISLVYCEISSLIKNLLLASVLFGAISINIFIGLMLMSSLITHGHIGNISFETYFLLTGIGGTALAAIYFGIKTKKFNKT